METEPQNKQTEDLNAYAASLTAETPEERKRIAEIMEDHETAMEFGFALEPETEGEVTETPEQIKKAGTLLGTFLLKFIRKSHNSNNFSQSNNAQNIENEITELMNNEEKLEYLQLRPERLPSKKPSEDSESF